jgi:YegS/Rv2252/BmrU family lipid kinase
MKSRHIVFIINPKSGVDRKKEIKKSIDTYLDSTLYSHELLYTEYARHGTLLAATAAAAGAYAVVAVGGDGSVNDVVQGLMGTSTLLAIIPKGSGNGMARTINIPINVDAAMQLINKGNIVEMDIGFAGGHPFISNAGVAFDALIARKFAKSEKRGLMAYSWLVTKYMWLYKERDFKITIDGKELNRKAFMVVVANGQQFGYNFRIAPMASYSDGLLDVIIVRKFPKITGALLALRGLTGTISGSPYVEHISGREIAVSSPMMKLMQVDGDAHECSTEISFTLRQGAQRVIAP